KNLFTIVAMFFLMLSTRSAGGMTGTVADLPSDLREALVHDAACAQTSDASGPSESGPPSILASQVNAQEIHGPKAMVIGVIATLSGGCHCHGPNCGTYVYLKSDSGYKLAFSGEFASVHPSRVYKGGYPSLSAKAQISDTQAESTVYDWNGRTYAPNLCATITQTPGRKVPALGHHPCPKTP